MDFCIFFFLLFLAVSLLSLLTCKFLAAVSTIFLCEVGDGGEILANLRSGVDLMLRVPNDSLKIRYAL